jgi:hypothetical protein
MVLVSSYFRQNFHLLFRPSIVRRRIDTNGSADVDGVGYTANFRMDLHRDIAEILVDPTLIPHLGGLQTLCDYGLEEVRHCCTSPRHRSTHHLQALGCRREARSELLVLGSTRDVSDD